MIHAYDRNMRYKAQVTLGSALDCAAYGMGYVPQDFMSLFIESDYADRFGKGDPSVVMGLSGIELCLRVFEETIGMKRPFEYRFTAGRSKEYWIGWALAFYQWETGLSFYEILSAIPMRIVDDMYSVYHEMDIEAFVIRMEELYVQACPQTNLQRLRKRVGLTQEQLAERSGVSARTIQQYEQRRKDMNKAQFETVMLLAQALHCEPSRLLERVG